MSILSIVIACNYIYTFYSKSHFTCCSDNSTDTNGPEEKKKADETLEHELKAAKLEIEALREQIKSLKIYKFGVERFINDDANIKFYTLRFPHLYSFCYYF